MSNLPSAVRVNIGRNLYQRRYHPVEIIKTRIYEYFGLEFERIEGLNPQVSVEDNFDRLLIPKDHPARSRSDTYYIDATTVLRTHTSAHQHQLLSAGHCRFLVTGDVYRKDEIDRNHYPIFHQMEGVCITSPDVDPVEALKRTLEGLIQWLFPGCVYRMVADYFPFTSPSFEIEVEFHGKWLEVLGCGEIRREILISAGLPEKSRGWAFGLGLERLAMILFEIPDIRYFWTEDRKFLDQFTSGDIVKFKPYSRLEPISKDISFWIPDDQIQSDEYIAENWKWKMQNDFYDLCREFGNDSVQEVTLLDQFYHSRVGCYSQTYRVTYAPVDTNITNPAEFNTMVHNWQDDLRDEVQNQLNVDLR